MSRLTRVGLLVLLIGAFAPASAFAQAPGQIPGTPPPGSPVPPPPSPPAVAAPPVPSVVTPIPTPSYGIPPGVTRPVIGGSSPLRVYGRAPAPRKKTPRRRRHPHVSEIPNLPVI